MKLYFMIGTWQKLEEIGTYFHHILNGKCLGAKSQQSQLLLRPSTACFGLQQQRNIKKFHMATTDRESSQQRSEEI
jgi:hypothetical protein